MERLDLNKALKISVIVGVLLIGVSVAYYLLIFLPQKERLAIQRYNQEKTDECLDGLRDEMKGIASRFVSTVDKDLYDFEMNLLKQKTQRCSEEYGGEIRF